MIARLPRRSWMAVCGTLACGYVALWVIASQVINFGGASDLNPMFWPAVREVLAGHPLSLYAAHSRIYGINHGPLSLAPLSASAALLRAAGLFESDAMRRAVAGALYGGFSLLMAHTAVATVVAARGDRGSSRAFRVGLSASFLMMPSLWWGGLVGHVEVPMGTWFLLRSINAGGGIDVARAALADRRAMSAGFWLGMAVLTRSTAVLLAVPVAAVTLVQRGVRTAAIFTGTALLVTGAVMAPFIAADSANVRYSLFGVRAQQNVRWGTLMALTVGTPLEQVARRADFLVVLCAIALVTGAGLAVAGARVRHRVNIAVLLTATAACFPLLVKFGLPYCTAELSVFGLTWLASERGGPHRYRAAVAFALSQLATGLLAVVNIDGRSDEVNLMLSIVCAGVLLLIIPQCLAVLREPGLRDGLR